MSIQSSINKALGITAAATGFVKKEAESQANAAAVAKEKAIANKVESANLKEAVASKRMDVDKLSKSIGKIEADPLYKALSGAEKRGAKLGSTESEELDRYKKSLLRMKQLRVAKKTQIAAYRQKMKLLKEGE